MRPSQIKIEDWHLVKTTPAKLRLIESEGSFQEISFFQGLFYA